MGAVKKGARPRAGASKVAKAKHVVAAKKKAPVLKAELPKRGAPEGPSDEEEEDDDEDDDESMDDSFGDEGEEVDESNPLSANMLRTVEKYRALLNNDSGAVAQQLEDDEDDDDEEDDDDDEEEDDDDDEEEDLEPIVEVTTKKGMTRYKVRRIEGLSTFATREQAEEFMCGDRYKKALRIELQSIRLAKRALRSPGEEAKRAAAKEAREAKRHAAKKQRKKARVLTDDQIEVRKAKFQRKKQRRRERAAAAAA